VVHAVDLATFELLEQVLCAVHGRLHSREFTCPHQIPDPVECQPDGEHESLTNTGTVGSHYRRMGPGRAAARLALARIVVCLRWHGSMGGERFD
jgi:hypothetical protein